MSRPVAVAVSSEVIERRPVGLWSQVARRRHARLSFHDTLFLKLCLAACDRNHQHSCVPKPLQDLPDEQVPDWLIEVEHACIVQGRCANRYVALSYLWAGNQQPDNTSLRKDNLRKLKIPGCLMFQSLPKIVEQAMDVVKTLGERYLWVDALCNVQDGDQIAGQVGRMNYVYANAYFTIIAATTPPGLFSEDSKYPLDLTAPERHRLGKGTDSLEGDYDLVEEHFIGKHYEKLFASTWNTRGWTFQEQVLSNRAIIFMDGDMFWDCRRSHSPVRDMAHQMFSSPWPNFRAYTELVCRYKYNYRDLGQPTDILRAFLGVLNSLAPSSPGGFVGGLPRLFLDESLSWQPLTCGKRRSLDHGNEDLSSCFVFPPWSWCGWQCCIDPASLRSGLAYLGDKDNMSEASSWRTRHLVQWTLLTPGGPGDKHEEPAILDDYKSYAIDAKRPPPNGWTRHVVRRSSGDTDTEYTYFTHFSDPTSRFRHPVPVNDNGSATTKSSPTVPRQSFAPILSCRTTRTFFNIHSLLAAHAVSRIQEEVMRVSAFKKPSVTPGDKLYEVCHVLCVEDRGKRGGGFLRLMGEFASPEVIELGMMVACGREFSRTSEMGAKRILGGFKDRAGTEPVEKIDKIELIAISTGSARRQDIEATFEEIVNKKLNIHFAERRITIHFERTPKQTGRLDPWGSSRTERRGTEEILHFYNVLWIERKDGIAYRRAASRIPKDVWESASPEMVGVLLG